MSQAQSEEKKREWKEIILQQSQSGLSIPQWCHKNNLTVCTFRYWKSKLFQKSTLDRSAFTEISGQKKLCVSNLNEKGIVIEYHGIRIHLAEQFHPSTLKQCLEIILEVLKEIAC